MADHDHGGADRRGFWNELYGERDRVWSGSANAVLVDVASALEPGRALELGCGEGADAVWLAERGWRVTGVDVSSIALARAAALAHAHGVTDAVDWVEADLANWEPASSYDLVTASFLHAHAPAAFDRDLALRRAAAAVGAGGRLLVVGHAAAPPWARDHHHERFPTPQEELTALALHDGAWSVEACEIRARDAVGPDGATSRLEDTVVLVRRR